jgi:lysophospholipase L1-like esterase
LWRSIVSVALVLAIAELGLRLLGLGNPYESEPDAYVRVPDPDVLFAPRPGFDGFSEGTRVRINALGLRDAERPTPKPADTARLLVLGDSVAFGFGVLAEESFPARLEAGLGRLADGRRYEVVNAGVVGYNTIQERARLEQVGLRLQPDVVILTFVVNDLLDTFSIFDHQYEPTGPLAPIKQWLRRNSRLSHFYQDVSWRIADSLRKDPNRPEAPRDRQRLFERELEIAKIAQLSRASGARFLLALYPDNLDNRVSADSGGRQETVREALFAFAAQQGLPVLDLTSAIGDVRDPRARSMRLREDPHPSPTGHQAIADALLPALRDGGFLVR